MQTLTRTSETVTHQPAEETRTPATSQPTPAPDPRTVTIADPDLREQAWCIEHLERLTIAGEPPETVAGIVSLLRVLYHRSSARDAASGRLWCNLSLQEIASDLGRHKKTVIAWLRAAQAAELVIDCPDPSHAQRLRRRPRWDTIAPQIRAAALAGKIPGPPLFNEAIDLKPDREPVTLTGGTTPPVSEKPEAPRHRLPETNFDLFDFSRGGVRGGSPFQGGSPLTPTFDDENRLPDGTGYTPTGGTTPPVSRERQPPAVQLLLDFDRRTQTKLDRLLEDVAATMHLVKQIFAHLFTPSAPKQPKARATSPRAADRPIASSAPRQLFPYAGEYGRELARELQDAAERLIAGMSDADVTRLARETGEHAEPMEGRELTAATLRAHPGPAMKKKIADQLRTRPR